MKAIKSEYWDSFYLIGAELMTNEFMLEDSLKENGLEDATGYEISKCMEYIEGLWDKYIGNRIGHAPVEQFHDDFGYYTSYWANPDDRKVAEFARYLSSTSFADDDYHADDRVAFTFDIPDEIVRKAVAEWGDLGGCLAGSVYPSVSFPVQFLEDNGIEY